MPPHSNASTDLPFVVVDLETTGGSALFDRVLEVAAIRVQNGVVQDRLECLVEPGMPIPPFVTRITGINASLVPGKPAFDSLLPDLRRLMDGARAGRPQRRLRRQLSGQRLQARRACRGTASGCARCAWRAA